MQNIDEKSKKYHLPSITRLSLPDSLSSLIWISENKPLYSVWQDPNLYLPNLSNLTQHSTSNTEIPRIPCQNFYSSMTLDQDNKRVYMSDSIMNHLDLFDLEKQVILPNYFKLEKDLAKLLVCKLVLTDNNVLIGFTKDSSYFILDIRQKQQIVQEEKLPFKILCSDYNHNYETLALGLKYKGRYSHLDLQMKSLLMGKYSKGVMVDEFQSHINEDENFYQNDQIISIALSKTCKYKALGSLSKILLYKNDELECVQKTHSLPNSKDTFKINQLKFFPLVEGVLVSAGGDGNLQFFNMERRQICKKSISVRSDKKIEINSFLDVGWNSEGSWIYYTKGYDWKFGDLTNDPRKELIANKIYFTPMRDLFQNNEINQIFY